MMLDLYFLALLVPCSAASSQGPLEGPKSLSAPSVPCFGGANGDRLALHTSWTMSHFPEIAMTLPEGDEHPMQRPRHGSKSPNTWRRVLGKHLRGITLYPTLTPMEVENILFLTLPAIVSPRKVTKYLLLLSRQYKGGARAWRRFVENFLGLFMPTEELWKFLAEIMPVEDLQTLFAQLMPTNDLWKFLAKLMPLEDLQTLLVEATPSEGVESLITELYSPLAVEEPLVGPRHALDLLFSPSCCLKLLPDKEALPLLELDSKALVKLIVQYYVRLIDSLQPRDLLHFMSGQAKDNPLNTIARFSERLQYWLANQVVSVPAPQRGRLKKKIKNMARRFYDNNHLELGFLTSQLLDLGSLGLLIGEDSKQKQMYQQRFAPNLGFRNARSTMLSRKYIIPLFPVLLKDADYLRNEETFLEGNNLNMDKLRSMGELLITTFNGNKDMHSRLFGRVPKAISSHYHRSVSIAEGCFRELECLWELEFDDDWTGAVMDEAKVIVSQGRLQGSEKNK